MKYKADRVRAGRAALGIRLGQGGQRGGVAWRRGVACPNSSGGKPHLLRSLHHLSHLLGREGHQVLHTTRRGGRETGGRVREGGSDGSSRACCCGKPRVTALPRSTWRTGWKERPTVDQKEPAHSATSSTAISTLPTGPSASGWDCKAGKGRAGVGGCGLGAGTAAVGRRTAAGAAAA